jgi:ketosteroid isomerase-like protein
MMLVVGCNSAPPAVDTKGAEDAVRAANAGQLKAAQALDAAGAVAYYSDDATVMPPNEKMATDKASAEKAWAAMLVPGMQIDWTPSKVEAASNGDMVYDQGTYTLTMKGRNGKSVEDQGKYLAVWKKQADGKWKEVEDIWNSDLPAAGAAPVAAKKGKAAKQAKKGKKH